MNQETVTGSFVVRVVVVNHQQHYAVQNLRTGEIKVCEAAKEAIEYIEQAQVEKPP